jgi:arylsulfatase A-like enzyme
MTLVLTFAISVLNATPKAPAADPSATMGRPNVVIILVDDLGYGGLSCYGQTKYKTPAIDRMAAEGARLTHFNCPMSYCAPTRAALMTGRYPFRCGMSRNPAPDAKNPDDRERHLPESEVTLAQLFKQAGYATGMVGKWHLGHAKPEHLPTGRGFDEYFGIPYSNDMRPVQLLEGTKRAEYPVVQATLTRRYTERAIDFIERKKDGPFFLYLAHAMPHKPLAVSEEFYKKSGAGLYADAMIELDGGIGRVLERVRQLGPDRPTLVVFTSDNGATFGGSTGGLRGMKSSTYEGGYRVPCIAWMPGRIPAGHASAEPAVMMDLFATSLEWAGIAGPTDRVIDGRDIGPLFTSAAKSPHEAILGQRNDDVPVVRDRRWKLFLLPASPGLATPAFLARPYVDDRAPDGVTILAPYEQYTHADHPGVTTGDAPKAGQLFDLLADPAEQHDVAAENPEVVKRLTAAYEAIKRK